MSASLASGFALGFSLILAIGAQNAFVLRQGLRREHVFAVCLTSSVSDALLIAAGVGGSGALATNWPWFEPLMRYGGAAFLIWYGARSLHAAWQGGQVLLAQGNAPASLGATLVTLSTLTWLNPHVYLDTVVLIGSVSSNAASRTAFGFGAILSSFVFFFSLGYGARLLAPAFARPRAWQILDAGIGVVMWAIAAKLLFM